MKLLIKNSLPTFIIVSLIVVSFYFMWNLQAISESVYPSFYYIPFAVIFILTFFSFAFNKLKAFYMGLHILFLLLHQHQILSVFSPSIVELLFVLMPVNIAIILFVKDGAILSFQGKALGIIIMMELFLIFLFHKELTFSLQKSSVFNLPFLFGSTINLSILLFVLVGIILGISNVVNYTFDKTFFMGTILFMILSFYFEQQELGVELLLSAAGILLIISVIYRTYSMAYIDELTNIPSRRMLREDLMKLSSKYTIAMLDIDFFKKFNDTYGHDVGDDVLQLVASCLEKVTGGGKAYRYGGEEFTIVFPKKDKEDALSHLEDIRETISKTEYPYKNPSNNKTQHLKVTISIGVAEKDRKNKTTEDVIKAADKALYRAKKKGRNCVSK